jgi:site-specific DNA-methyltransferase (adenine-specific)
MGLEKRMNRGGTMWKLFCGDCLEEMNKIERGSIDAIITDPPYSSGGRTLSDRQQDPIKKYIHTSTKRKDITFTGDNRDQRSWCFWSILWMSHTVRLLKRGGRFYMFIDWRQLPTATDAIQSAGLIWRGLIAWDKGRGSRSPHTGYHRHQCEYVVFATKGPCEKAPGRGPFDGCFHAVIPQTKLHPTQKPEKIIQELVKTVEPGGLILDPFAGSGTTLLVAEKEGRNAIGIEIESEYCEIIRKRMAR